MGQASSKMMSIHISLGVLAALIGSIYGVCPTNYVELSTNDNQPPSCYRFVNEKANHATQKATCEADGANLVTNLDTNGLMFVLQEYILDRNYLKYDGFFVDGTDEGHEGTWTWADDSSMPTGAPYWWPGQPDNINGNANVACMYTPDFFLHDCRASVEMKAICGI